MAKKAKQEVNDTKPIYKFENWHTALSGDWFTAPECRYTVVVGDVETIDESGTKSVNKLISSKLLEVNGRNLECTDCKIELGEPNPNFLLFLKDNNIKYNPENPIRVLKKKEKRTQAVDNRSDFAKSLNNQATN